MADDVRARAIRSLGRSCYIPAATLPSIAACEPIDVSFDGIISPPLYVYIQDRGDRGIVAILLHQRLRGRAEFTLRFLVPGTEQFVGTFLRSGFKKSFCQSSTVPT